jgi:hypothetical protein
MTNLYIIAKPNRNNTENYHPSPPVLHRKQKQKAQPQQKKKKKISYKYSRVYLYRTSILLLEPGLSFQQQLF